MTSKDSIERALRELRFARSKPVDCGDNHSDEYRNRVWILEHNDLHVDRAISILEDLAKIV